jgi:hypothetical protein
MRISAGLDSFNPSRGIAIIQTDEVQTLRQLLAGFNPSRGIAIIQTLKFTTLEEAVA